jgi:hypothetical protein
MVDDKEERSQAEKIEKRRERDYEKMVDERERWQ